MDGDVVVREARVEDASEVVRLLGQLGHTQPAGDDRARFGLYLERGQHVLVAAHALSDQVPPLLGAVTLHITPVLHRAGPIGRLSALVVDEPARGKGVGRALVAAAEKFLFARGCALIEVTSNKKRTDAHAFYERLGYTMTSLRFAKSPDPRGPA